MTRRARTACPHRFGAHLSIAGGVSRALEEARRLRCDALQVFVKNQRQWVAPPLREDDVRRWHELRSRGGVGPIVAHATYLINLASADAALRRKSQRTLADELARCDQLAIDGLVVHPGAAGEQSRTRALRRVAESIDTIFSRHPHLRTPLLLELTAGQGTSLGCTFEELAEIIARVAEPQRLGVCIDTCHALAAGYDLRSPAGYAAMIEAAAGTVGLERIRCWHVNDSLHPLGSRRDRHAHIGHGHVGSAGFRNVLGDRRFVGLPMILETPKGTDHRGREWDKRNLAALRRIATRALR